MDEYGYSFVIMIKGMAKLVNRLVLENKGKFEEERKYSIRKHHVYGITVKDKLYPDDEKTRYFHIYHSTGKEHGEKEKHYFDTFYDNKGILTVVKENDKRKLTTKDTEGRGRRNEAGKSSWSEKKSEQMMFAECRSVDLVELFQEVNVCSSCLLIDSYVIES